MIEEAYVSFETAKLLKEKGFPQEYDIYHSLVYNEEDYEDEYEVQRMVLETKLVKAGTLSSYPISVPEPKCYCCTLQMAMKWLREIHNIHIAIIPCEVGPGVMDYTYALYKIDAKNFYFKDLGIQGRAENISKISYEETCEAAIKYCIENLI